MNGHDSGFWSGRRVLVTGHTGFKGAWLTTYLSDLGAEVLGISLPGQVSTPSLWECLEQPGLRDVRADIADRAWHQDALAFSPQVVLHLAAQSLVSRGYEDPMTTFRTNTLGTMNVMALLERLPDLEAALVVTTDKVYDTRQPPPYDEHHYLGGGDPYAASKAAAELVVGSWPSGAIRVATARAGNVIGGGDWSHDRIVPDMVRSWSAGEPLTLRRPDAVRPWQHVIEPLVGYLVYCEALSAGRAVPRTLNFGPDSRDAVTVRELVDQAADVWTGLAPERRPAWVEVDAPSWHETGELVLDASASKQHLGIENAWDWRQALSLTLDWYVRQSRGESARDLVLEQLRLYRGTIDGELS